MTPRPAAAAREGLDVGSEAGSTLLLTIFYASLALLLVLLVVAASSLYLERKRLFTVADGAALVAAESFTLDGSTPGAGGAHPLLSDGAIEASVHGYLADGAGDGFDRVTVIEADTKDGQSARLTLSAEWRPPVFALFAPDGIRLEVTSTARSVFD